MLARSCDGDHGSAQRGFLESRMNMPPREDGCCRVAVRPTARLALAANDVCQLVYLHDQLYSDRMNQNPPQARPGQLRP